MVDQSKANRLGLSPASYGIASLIAACLAWASIWLLFNMGPDGILNNRPFEAVVGLLSMFAFVCGLYGVGAGLKHKNWLGGVTGVLGLAMICLEAWFLLASR